MPSIKIKEESVLEKAKDLIKNAIFARKSGVVTMITNKSGRDLTYHITKRGYKVDRSFPKGMSGNISTTNELNAHVAERAGKIVSTTEDCNDTSTYTTKEEDIAKLMEKHHCQRISDGEGLETVIQDLLDSNEGLTREDLEIGYAVTSTQGYFVKLSEEDFPDKGAIDKSWGTQEGRYLFIKTSPTTGDYLEVYFNDDGQEPFFSDEDISVAELAAKGDIPVVTAEQLGIDLSFALSQS